MADDVNNISCLNCGFEYPESYTYCPSCGQKNEDSVLSFKEMFFDLLSSLFSFDTKAIRSLPRLFFRPGSLTKEYIQGKRETYLAPFRLYLFVSIVLFLVLPLVISDDKIFGDDMNIEDVLSDSLVSDIKEELVLDSIVTDIAQADTFLKDNLDGNFNFSLFSVDPNDSTGGKSWKAATNLVEEGYTTKAAVDSTFKEAKVYEKLLIRQGLKLQNQKGKGLIAEFLDKTSYALFLFLPGFALLLKLLYVRRKRYFIEHLIFALHFFSFFFFLIIFYVLIIRFIRFVPIWPIFVLSLIYLLAAMHRVYGQSWLKTIAKWIMLTFTTTAIFLPFFFVIVLVISLIFY